MMTVLRTSHKQHEENLDCSFPSPLLVPFKEHYPPDVIYSVISPVTPLPPLHLVIHPDLSSGTYQVFKLVLRSI